MTRAHYEMSFELQFMKKDGNAFQDFFSEIMEKVYPGDFIRVRPWGNVGDRKNDGYLRSSRTLFQLYAPNDLKPAAAIAKIDEDFYGALPHWQAHFDSWIFTHNSRRGLGPDVTAKILELRAKHPDITTTSWGFEEIRQQTFKLSAIDLASLLGSAPTQRDVTQLRYSDLRDVILVVAGQDPPLDQDILPVPPGKLAYNDLSWSATEILNTGMQKAPFVQNFFDRWTDPLLGDRVAETFRRRYQSLRGVGMIPDDIFSNLYAFAGGDSPDYSASQKVASWAVLAYLFEACDIFERPPVSEGA